MAKRGEGPVLFLRLEGYVRRALKAAAAEEGLDQTTLARNLIARAPVVDRHLKDPTLGARQEAEREEEAKQKERVKRVFALEKREKIAERDERQRAFEQRQREIRNPPAPQSGERLEAPDRRPEHMTDRERAAAKLERQRRANSDELTAHVVTPGEQVELDQGGDVQPRSAYLPPTAQERSMAAKVRAGIALEDNPEAMRAARDAQRKKPTRKGKPERESLPALDEAFKKRLLDDMRPSWKHSRPSAEDIERELGERTFWTSAEDRFDFARQRYQQQTQPGLYANPAERKDEKVKAEAELKLAIFWLLDDEEREAEGKAESKSIEAGEADRGSLASLAPLSRKEHRAMMKKARKLKHVQEIYRRANTQSEIEGAEEEAIEVLERKKWKSAERRFQIARDALEYVNLATKKYETQRARDVLSVDVEDGDHLRSQMRIAETEIERAMIWLADEEEKAESKKRKVLPLRK